MINLFCGYDKREAIGFHVFVESVLEHASVPVAIHALDSRGLTEGSNSFTLSRFLVPYLMGFEGRAIFADACDMLMLEDIAELDALFDNRLAIQVVAHMDYLSKHPRKYVGTDLECVQTNYGRKNWASLMLMNCAHPLWAAYTPENLKSMRPIDALQLIDFPTIGHLPNKWNRLVDEGQELEGAAVLHWTCGIPIIGHYCNSPGSQLWIEQYDKMWGVL